jgi:hypothetical protein
MTHSSLHRSKWRRGVVALAVVMGSVALSACAEEVIARPGWRGEAIAVEPPIAQAEIIGVAPHPGWVWQPGYYDYVGGRHVWTHGAWVEGRAGYHWVPHTWVHEGGGWRLREGYWGRD